MDLKAVGNFVHEVLKLDGSVGETASVVVGRSCLKLAIKRLVVACCVIGTRLLHLVRLGRNT
jgi:formylmethanofuran dehydrogenase subunit E